MLDNSILTNIIDLLSNCQFREMCDKYFADDFLWIIKGTSMLSGTYDDKEYFFKHVIGRLSAVLESDWKMHINTVHQAADTLIIEMLGEVKAKNGDDYNNEYCWIMKFEEIKQQPKITSLTAYYDSLLVDKTLIQNESC